MKSLKSQAGNTTASIVIVLLLLIIVGGGFWYFTQPETKMRKIKMNEDKAMMKDGAMEEKDAMMEDGMSDFDKRVMDGETIQADKDEDTAMMMEKEAMMEDKMMKEVDDAMMSVMKDMTFAYSGQLFDVTKGLNLINGFNTGGFAAGTAMANYEAGAYTMMATFEGVPQPAGTDFLEGWLVRKSPFDFISTGKVEMVDGVLTNSYSSAQDLTEYDFYVLTLEPDDGDPAPAEHVVEGTMTMQK